MSHRAAVHSHEVAFYIIVFALLVFVLFIKPASWHVSCFFCCFFCPVYAVFNLVSFWKKEVYVLFVMDATINMIFV